MMSQQAVLRQAIDDPSCRRGSALRRRPLHCWCKISGERWRLSPAGKISCTKVLRLQNNSIENIYGVATATLPLLKELYLDGNPTAAVTVFLSAALESLFLTECNISTVNAVAFTHLPKLRRVHLSRNHISYVNGSAFHKLSELTKFKAEENVIVSLEDTFSKTRALKVIDLSSNKISDISNAFRVLDRLEELDLRKNHIEYLRDDTFANNGNLKRINLGENSIIWLGKNCFRGLVSLHYLYLGDNRIISLNGSLANMPTLGNVYLGENRLQVLHERDFWNDPRLRILYVFRNRLIDVRGAFRRLHKLESLLLQSNNLKTIHRASLPANASSLRLFGIEGNPFSCDCRLSWLSELPVNATIGDPTCRDPPRLKGSLLWNSATAATLKNRPEDCDDSCTCSCRLDGDYGKYTHVNCSNANLVRPPDTFPEDAFVLDLSMNRLESLSESFASRVPRLRSLLLGDNLFKSLDPRRLPRGLQELSLRNNSFAQFPMDIVTRFNLSSLWLAGNPWACECEDYAFRQWASRNAKTIRDADSVTCAEGTNPRTSLKLFTTLEQKDFCPQYMALSIGYAVAVLVILTLALCLTVAYLKREREVKVWLYAHHLHCVKEYDVDKDKVFDVFLSFSSKDGNWAYANLVPRIEEAGFSVCTYDRNFKGGFILQDTIQEAVACSRRTLLLLTQNFVQSEWCRWEFRLAHHNALEDKINRLIVVVPDGVPESVDEELALYMKVTNYLRWGEKHFWSKLMYSLPKTEEKHRGLQIPVRAPLSIIYEGQETRRTVPPPTG